MEALRDWLVNNKTWLDISSGIIAFVSAVFGIFYKDTVIKNPKTNRNKLTGWGLFTLITLLCSSFIQGILKYTEKTESQIASEKLRIEKEKEDSVQRQRFKVQLDTLQLLNNSLKEISSKSGVIIDSTISLSNKSTENINKIQKLNSEYNQTTDIEYTIREFENENSELRNKVDSLNTSFFRLFESFAASGYIRRDQQGILHLHNQDKLGIIDFEEINKMKKFGSFDYYSEYDSSTNSLLNSITNLLQQPIDQDKEKQIRYKLIDLYNLYWFQKNDLINKIKYNNANIQDLIRFNQNR